MRLAKELRVDGPTCEGNLPGYLWERGIDELLEVDLFVFDIVQRLPRAKRCLTEAERAGGFVAVQRLHI